MVGAGLDPRRAGLVVAVLVAATPISAPAEAAASTVADRYTFQNVRIGGTGLVTGIVFSEAQRDPAYARTDVGGAYAAFSTDGGVT
jgi:xyloglucan-specific exo-beta-1,4-glucanase